MPCIPFPVVLASASPRRRRLLAELIPAFAVVPADVDEEAITCADPYATAERLARAKASAVAHRHPNAVVIGGDTVVAISQSDDASSDWEMLAKPADAEDAVRMLRKLTGRTHLVVTGICLVWPGGERTFHDASWVTFRPASEQEIRTYVATGEPLDKAGAYGIQDASHDFCTRIDGSTANVVGLPTEKLGRVLRELWGD
ncbi:MAG: Maf family protein [Fimbriimonadaceae bacterium]